MIKKEQYLVSTKDKGWFYVLRVDKETNIPCRVAHRNRSGDLVPKRFKTRVGAETFIKKLEALLG